MPRFYKRRHTYAYIYDIDWPNLSIHLTHSVNATGSTNIHAHDCHQLWRFASISCQTLLHRYTCIRAKSFIRNSITIADVDTWKRSLPLPRSHRRFLGGTPAAVGTWGCSRQSYRHGIHSSTEMLHHTTKGVWQTSPLSTYATVWCIVNLDVDWLASQECDGIFIFTHMIVKSKCLARDRRT